MSYAGAHNFIGRRVDGYDAAECILTRQAAQGLVRVQAELAPRGYSLIVWDCYRPVRAVRDFVNWSRLPNEARMKAEFFPNTDKANFFQQGYLATRSAHSRGSTVDLGIVPSSLREIPKFDMAGPLKPCTAPKGQRFEDGTIDLGTEHDCLDPQASTISPNISKEAQANRLMLREAMLRAGFKPYSKEWWHFELVDEPFQHAFDFPVVARGAAPAERPLPLAEADRSQQQATIGSQWTEFRLAVLKRQAGVVAKMTKFPLASSSRLLSPPAFIAEFKSIFDGDMTACIALQQPVQSNIGKSTFSLTCALGEKRATLNFQIIDGNWRLFAIEGENEADGEIAKVIEQGRANVEPHVPDAVRMAPKRSPPKVKKASPKAAQSKSEKVEPEAERVQSNEERGSPNGEREQ
jgi:D-alanyl-D-alanine dipeptidase